MAPRTTSPHRRGLAQAARLPATRLLAARLLATLWLAALLALLPARTGAAAELVMFETRTCPWCAAWDAEVGTIYDKTSEAVAAPLRRVDLDAARPSDLAGIRPVHYTPTFVLMDAGREVGRIQGYPGEDSFWGLLSVLIDKLGPAPDVGG